MTEEFKMTPEELAEHYINISLKYEEENYVECGFKKATEERNRIYEKIKTGRVSSKEMKAIEPVFHYGNIDIREHLKIEKRFFIF